MIQLTADGSHTLLSDIFGVTYHSKHGAIQETQVVFIDAAFAEIIKDKKTVSILEIGFGTGLNALMTFGESLKNNITLHYTTVEKYPIDAETVAVLNYKEVLAIENCDDFYNKIHTVEWNQQHQLTPLITVEKRLMAIEDIDDDTAFDAIYYDAFAPNSQPELWTTAIFEKMYKALRPNGVLTTYCAKGEVKRNLKAAGFVVENLPGPIGKREMTRARKM